MQEGLGLWTLCVAFVLFDPARGVTVWARHRCRSCFSGCGTPLFLPLYPAASTMMAAPPLSLWPLVLLRVRKQRSCSGVLAAVYCVRCERHLGHGSFRLQSTGWLGRQRRPRLYAMASRRHGQSELECSATITRVQWTASGCDDCYKRTSSCAMWEGAMGR